MDDLIARLLAWFIRWLGMRTLLSLVLLLTAMGSVALGLADLIRGLDDTLVLPVAEFGVLLGWLLARSPLASWKAGSLAFVLGAQAIFVSVGHLAPSLVKLLRSLAPLAWEVLRWPLVGAPDGSPVTSVLLEVGTSAEMLLIRVRDWLLAVIQGQAAFDPVATALVWSLAVWMATVWAGWAVRRRYQTLQGIAPAAALLAISLSYTWDHPSPLWVLLGATLPLMVITQQTARERRWLSAGMDFSPEVRVDLAVATIWVSLALLAAAILVPSISVRSFARSAHRLLAEHLGAGKQLADSMGLEPLAGPGIAFEQARAAGLPNRSLIGAGPELSEQVMMVIHLEGQQHIGEIPTTATEVPLSYYWRAVTYDHYTGRGWRTGTTEMVEYLAGELAAWEAPPGYSEAAEKSAVHRTVRQEVQAVGDLGGLLYRAGELVTADQDFRVAWRSPTDAFGAEIEATVYQADSRVPVVSEALLRSARSNYPSWVQDRYLALPDEITARVLMLAHDLTAVKPTPYDKARAIETYLRAIPYTLDLPAPPPNREVTDYFLFDLRQGFCDYYATAMVVLARAVGLPARFVTGYVSGTYHAVDARYVVSAADAHSWVEIYFPDYGWIEFEPTGGRPAIERPAETLVEMLESETGLEPLTGGRIGKSRRVWLGMLGGLALLGLGGFAWWCADVRRLWRSPPAATVTMLYQRLYRHGRRLAVSAEAGDTPHEFATALTGRVTELAGERDSKVALTAVSERVSWLTELYVRALYSPHEPSAIERAQAIQTWKRLRQHLWRAWIWQKRGGRKRRA